jgi:hypothetical protein
MADTGRPVFVVAEDRRVAISTVSDTVVEGLGLNEDLTGFIRGGIEYMRTYKVRTGLLWETRQSRSRSEFQPRSPGSKRVRHFPIRMFVAHPYGAQVQPIEALDDLFVRDTTARQHPELAGLAGREPRAFFAS